MEKKTLSSDWPRVVMRPVECRYQHLDSKEDTKNLVNLICPEKAVSWKIKACMKNFFFLQYFKMT